MNNRNDINAPESSELDALLNSQVQLLRSRVEAELKKPAVVLVTSAHLGDGKSLTASSLATCFAKSGHRAALVNENRSGADGVDPAVSERFSHGHVTSLELPPESDNAVSRENLTAFVTSLRGDYDYAIVDAGSYLDSNSAMALAQLVDGILLTVRVGRSSSEKDEMMARMIEHFRGNVIGVVATDAEAIAEFERGRPRPSAATERAQKGKAGRKPARVLATSMMSAVMLLLLASSSRAGQSGPAVQQTFSDFQSQVAGVVQRVGDLVRHYDRAYPALSAGGNQQPATQAALPAVARSIEQ